LCSWAALAVAVAVSLLAMSEASAQALRLAGTGGGMPMMQKVAAAYVGTGGPRIEVIVGLGSGGAIKAAADGAIDLAVSARDLKPEETALGLTAVHFARTPLVFITSLDDPPNLNSADIAGLFAAVQPRWPDGTPLSVILRTASDADSLLVQDLFPGLREALEAARIRPELPVTPTDQDNATLAEQLPGSLVQAGLSQILVEKRDLRVVTLDGVAPTLANLENGTYPYEKRFYLVFPDRKAATAEALLGFMRSDSGRGVLRDSGSLLVE
jgi:phosphate transport system substrate-binding protein